MLGRGVERAERLLEDGKSKSAFKALHQYIRLAEEMEPDDEGAIRDIVAPYIETLNGMAESPQGDFSGVDQLLAGIKEDIRRLLVEKDLQGKGLF